MTINRLLAGVAVILTLGLTACGPDSEAASAGPDDGATANPAAGMCLEGAEDCMDTPQLASDQPVAIDETGIAQFRRDAKYYLGKPRSELTELIRIARIGDEQMAVTDDYVVGRITVELDKIDGTMIVTSATVELPDEPETFKLDR